MTALIILAVLVATCEPQHEYVTRTCDKLICDLCNLQTLLWMLIRQKGASDWLEVQILMKDGWRYTFLDGGALCVTVTSASLMPLLCAVSWDTQLIVIGGVGHLEEAVGSAGCNMYNALGMKLTFFSAEEGILEFAPLPAVPTMMMLESLAQVRFLYMHY